MDTCVARMNHAKLARSVWRNICKAVMIASTKYDTSNLTYESMVNYE